MNENIPQTILITGASSGIGAGLAVYYASTLKNDVRLCLVARNEIRLNEVAGQCRESGATVEIAIIDVTDADKMEKQVQDWDAIHPIDLLIANAGISGGTAIGFESASQMRKIFDVNVTGVINTVVPILSSMIERKSGQIVLMSSLAGFRGLPSAPAYSGSKNAVRAWGDALRLNLKKTGVKVNVICPGFIKTPLTDQNPFEMPFLMSVERAAHIIATGVVRNKPRIAFPWQMAWGIRLVSVLPRPISDWIVARMPNK